MTDHQATTEQLQAMRDARRRLAEAHEAAGDAPEPGSQALNDLAEAAGAFHKAVRVVLYGPQDASPKRLKSAYEASNQMARDHWPTPGGTPGG
ncbi:hypothetical protein [Streptomyces scabiei]|uniref:hypothetical protein n=1 Tax=Streptomyces scabiei TaxID=1930 RepID=UPI0029A2CD1F|nr:hypothetical protein [Streptomyces scabiei]MDX2802390.1 hypothetical protein [Streptomyces scabiei]